MIQPINAVSAPKTLKPVQPVAKVAKQNKQVENSIDKRQNDEVMLHLNYIGQQLQGILNAKAGKEVKVEKFANKLDNDDKRTPAQKQKDNEIVALGYIGDVLKKINDVENGKLEEEKPSKQSKRVRV